MGVIQNSINRLLYFGRAYKIAKQKYSYYKNKNDISSTGATPSNRRVKTTTGKMMTMRKKAFTSAIEEAEARMTQRNAFQEALSGKFKIGGGM